MSLPLNSIAVNAPFQQWDLEFIGEINHSSSGQHKWILTATDFFTKWVEAIPTRNATDKVIIDFIQENIVDLDVPRSSWLLMLKLVNLWLW